MLLLMEVIDKEVTVRTRGGYNLPGTFRRHEDPENGEYWLDNIQIGYVDIDEEDIVSIDVEKLLIVANI